MSNISLSSAKKPVKVPKIFKRAPKLRVLCSMSWPRATVSRTGHFSTEIGPFERLMDAWADIVNARGGLMVKGKQIPVKFTIYDDKSDQAAARKYYERLITVDKVDLLLGPYSSPLTFAASTAAENHQVPFIAICANSPKIYTRGFEWIVAVIDIGPRYTYRY